MRKCVLLGLLAVLGFGIRSGMAQQLTLNVSSAQATPGQENLEIEIRVSNFTNVLSLQYTFQWNKDILQFVDLTEFNAAVPGIELPATHSFGAALTSGYFTMAWIENGANPITLPANTLLYKVRFNVIGDVCKTSPVSITSDLTGSQAELVAGVLVSGQTVEVVPVVNNGVVTIPGEGCNSPVRIYGNLVTAPCNGTACVQIRADNFTEIGLLEYTMNFDTNILRFKEFRGLTTLLPGFGVGSSLNHPNGTNQLRTVWTHPSLSNVTIPSGTVLYEICFDLIGAGGGSTDIVFAANPVPTAQTILHPVDFNNLDLELTPATISAECEVEGFALIADKDVCVMPGNTVCIDVKVNEFVNMIAMEFCMLWDPNLFHFNRVEGLNLEHLTMDAFAPPGSGPNIQEGQLAVAWIDFSTAGITVPNATTIFTLCLDAVGSAGTTSQVTFGTNQHITELIFASTETDNVPYSLIHGSARIRANCDGCELSYTVSATSPACPGQSNGSINLTVIEDCPCTPTFLWSAPGNPTTEDISNIPAGIYSVTITCAEQAVIAMVTVTDPPSISVSATITHPDPPGSSNGAINITVSGGAPPYTFLWSHGGVTTEDISGLPKGFYTVTITDNKGCQFVPDPFEVGADLDAVITHITCPGDQNGAINLSLAFGTPPYNYQWSNSLPPNQNQTGLSAGTYCVTVTESGGSTRDACFTVNVTNLPPTVTATITNDVNENCQGAIDLNVVGGTQPFSYSWSNQQTTQDITGLCGGQYCVTITYGQGCALDTCFALAAGNLGVSLTALQYGSYQVSCANNCDGSITATPLGGTPPFNFAWSGGGSSNMLDDLCAGNYSVTVTDAGGRTATAVITLNAPPSFSLSYITTNPTDYLSSNGAISVVVNGGTPPFTYAWSGPASGNTAALNNVPAGTYTIKVTDGNGCSISETRQLLPLDGIDCFTAISVITPNSDGYNDYFTITCVYDFPNHLRIFNRAGALVFEVRDYQNNWSGTGKNNEPLPDGGYMWVLEFDRPNGTTDIRRGTVTLLRTAD